MVKSALLIVNPTAGQEKATNYEKEIEEVLEVDYDRIEVKYTEGEGDATKFAKKAAEDDFDLVVALGGDGTVNETINGLASFDQPPKLGIIPLGTVNDLARSLNISLKTTEAIDLLVSGSPKKIDVGLANERYFTNFLIVGNASKAIHDVDSAEKSKLGSFAYFIEVAKKIAEDDIFQVKLEMDSTDWKGEASIIIVGLIDSFGGFKSILADAELGDSIFHILVIKELSVPELMKMSPKMLSGKIKKSENVSYFTSKSIRVSALDQDINNSDIDGEKGPELPIDLTILPRHLSVIAGLD